MALFFLLPVKPSPAMADLRSKLPHGLLLALRTFLFSVLAAIACSLIAFWDAAASSILWQIDNLSAPYPSDLSRPGTHQHSDVSFILLIDHARRCLWTHMAIAFDQTTRSCRMDASRPMIPAFFFRLPQRNEGVTVLSLEKDLRGYGFNHSSALSPFASGNGRFAASCKLRCKPSFSSELQTHRHDTHLAAHYDFKRPESMSSLQVAVRNIASLPPAPAEFTSTIFWEGTQHYALQFGVFQRLCALIQPFSGILSSCVMTHDHPSRSATLSTRGRTYRDVLQSAHRPMDVIGVQDSAHSVVGLVHWLAGIGRYNSFIVTWNANQWMSIITNTGYRPVSLDQGFGVTEELAFMKMFWDLGVPRPIFHTFPLQSSSSHGDTFKLLRLPSPLTYAIMSIEGLESKPGEQQAFDTCSSGTRMLPRMNEEDKKQQPETWWDEDAVVLGGMLQQRGEEENKQQQLETWWDEDAVLLGDTGESIYGGFEKWKPVSTLANKQSKSFFSVCKRTLTAMTASFSPSSTR